MFDVYVIFEEFLHEIAHFFKKNKQKEEEEEEEEEEEDVVNHFSVFNVMEKGKTIKCSDDHNGGLSLK